MTQTDNSAFDRHPTSPVARLAWMALILATLYTCYFHNLGAIGLVGPDEPRYAWIARDMAETGDWVTPRLYGKPWFEKPVLYYWGAALSFKLFGVSEASARFPSALAALLATLAMAWLAWRSCGQETARWLLLLLPTTVGMIGFSHAAATDMPFAAMLTMAMVFAAVVLGLVPQQNTAIVPRTHWLALFFFGFFLGLAVLAKGPAAIVLSGGAVLLWAAISKRWRDAFRCLHPLAILSFCLTALPWYILCTRRNPDFFRIFIIEHNFKRYLTPEFQHIQPFWYYLPVVLIAFVPWTLILLWSIVVRLFPRERKIAFSPITIFLLSWATFCLVFFSISKSKLPGYVLPSVPPIGLLVALSCVPSTPRGGNSFRWIHLGFSLLCLPAATLLAWMGYEAGSLGHRQQMISAAYVLILLGLANLLLSTKFSSNRYVHRIAPLCVLPILVLVALFNPVARAWLTPDPSAKALTPVIQQLQFRLPASEFFVLPVNRTQKFGLSFYLHRDVQFWDPENMREGLLLLRSGTTTQDCERYVQAPWSCLRSPIEIGSSGWVAYRVHRANTPRLPMVADPDKRP